MRTLRRNKRIIYVCNRYQDDKIVKYRQPIKLRVNYQYTNSDSDLIALGLDYPMYIRIKADLDDLKYFNPNDRVYIKVKPSVPFDELCKDADFEVDKDPIDTLNSGEVRLKRLSGKR